MTERLQQRNHNLGRRIGAVGMGVGLMLSQSEVPAGAFVSSELPAFDQAWPADDHSVLASAHFNSDTLSYTIDDALLPKPYSEAFHSFLRSPFTMGSMNGEYVRSVTLRKSTEDNSQWDAEGRDVTLHVSSGRQSIEERLYFDMRALKAAALRETANAVNEEWYAHYSGNPGATMPPASVLPELDALRDAKQDFDDLYYADVPAPCKQPQGATKEACSNTQTLQNYTNETYRCVELGASLQQEIGIDRTIPIENRTTVSDIASSLIVNLEMNPDYVPDCLDNDQSERSHTLRRLVKQTLTVIFETKPELQFILGRTDERKEAIERLIA